MCSYEALSVCMRMDSMSMIATLSMWQVKVDLVGLAQECCPELDLKAELERSFLSEPSSPGHTKTPKGFRLGKHKHETFITRYSSSVWLHLNTFIFVLYSLQKSNILILV